ncbi:MAG: sulfite exporter TauE/SafE family protein [Candidatus Liptonbacteria bacterium]
MQFVLIFLTAALATILSSMSGGGSSIIALPIFLSMGIEFPVATVMQKVSACFWVLPSAFNYLKGRKVDWAFVAIFSLVGLVGAYFGVLSVINLDQRILKTIVGWFIVILVVHIYFKEEAGSPKEFIRSKSKEIVSYILALPMGFYESILGSGNGIIFATVSLYAKGFDFISALGYYFMVAFSWVVLATVVLVGKGFFSWGLVVPAVLGSLAGGYAGSRFARFKGNKFIKIVFVVVGGFLGIKLIFGF